VPAGCGAIGYFDAFCGLKQRHGLTLIGIGHEDGHVDLNCGADKVLKPGDIIYYISDHRWSPADIDWTGICRGAVAA
jgi:voltage-gated potassium channel